MKCSRSPSMLLMLLWLFFVTLFVRGSSLRLLRPPFRRPTAVPRDYRRWEFSEDQATALFRLPAKLRLRRNKQRAVDESPILELLTPELPPMVQQPIGKKITNAHELRRRVLDEGVELRKLQVDLQVSNATVRELLDHDVIQLIVDRFHSKSTPGNRAKSDTARLALSMEGGGMRGAVSAGMAAALACLGLTDTFDAIYGSSAGSVIGAYMVSRQMCMDVYVDILPAAKNKFVCIKRMLAGVAGNAFDLALSRVQEENGKLGLMMTPGMNISFVLDGIMDHSSGIRPLDLERFRENDQKQPLRVAASYVKDGQLKTKCFGTNEFFSGHEDAVKRKDGVREGIYACLEASMTVPGATGPPVQIQGGNNTVYPFFDAFCFEPLPYRSAVEEGATHVLALCSRPEGFQPKTKPGVYELGVAPLYFRSHGQPEVARFFEKGGQQYIYAEDLLVLEEGKRAAGQGGVLVPPPSVLHGVERDQQTQQLASNRDTWKQAHLLPIKVPLGTPELSTLEQDRDNVVEAVRAGFAAAFDLLAPAIGLELDASLSGTDVARLVFPQGLLEEDVLETQLRVLGDAIVEVEDAEQGGKRYSLGRVLRRMKRLRIRQRAAQAVLDDDDSDDQAVVMNHIDHLLISLPGFQQGRMLHLARNLHNAQRIGN